MHKAGAVPIAPDAPAIAGKGLIEAYLRQVDGAAPPACKPRKLPDAGQNCHWQRQISGTESQCRLGPPMNAETSQGPYPRSSAFIGGPFALRAVAQNHVIGEARVP
jgi:hypothetical protein